MRIRVKFTGESWGDRKGKEEEVSVYSIVTSNNEIFTVDNEIIPFHVRAFEEAKPISISLPEVTTPKEKILTLGVNEYLYLLSVANQMLGFIIGAAQLNEKSKTQFQYWDEMINEATARIDEAMK